MNQDTQDKIDILLQAAIIAGKAVGDPYTAANAKMFLEALLHVRAEFQDDFGVKLKNALISSGHTLEHISADLGKAVKDGAETVGDGIKDAFDKFISIF